MNRSLFGSLAEPLHAPARLALRVLLIAGAAWVLWTVGGYFEGVIVPVCVAILVTALLSPANRWLRGRWRLNRYLTSALLLAGLSLLVILVLGVTLQTLSSGYERIVSGTLEGITALRRTMQSLFKSVGLSPDLVDDYAAKARTWIEENRSELTNGALRLGGEAISVLFAGMLAAISLFFFLADGRRLWRWFLDLVPDDAATAASERIARGWRSLEVYARTQVVIAGVDSVGITLGALVLGVPFAVPIAVIVFLTAFIPFLGAIMAGVVAVLLTLATKGLGSALVMLVVVIVVQQVESNLIAPLLYGNAVSVHPWAVLVGVFAAAYVFGVIGMLLAVPTMAFVQAAFTQPSEGTEGTVEDVGESVT